MAARDRYSYEILCPSCKQTGRLHVSEEDHPYITNPDRTVDKIDGEFSAEVKDGIEVLITCTNCGTNFTNKP